MSSRPLKYTVKPVRLTNKKLDLPAVAQVAAKEKKKGKYLNIEKYTKTIKRMSWPLFSVELHV